ncbi:flavin reductase [Rhodococcus fascians]|nr:flavin reductase [Rhodococcus fascians]
MTPDRVQQQYREVLGQYPTGVVVVTAAPSGSSPVGLTIGSFSSVSLDPPLVAFYPNKGSNTWAKIREGGRFCINVLGAEQEAVCRGFASRSLDKFAGIDWRPAPGGSPIIDGAVAWIDCELEDVQELGDHFLVVGRVTALEAESRDLPLLFFRGGYGRFLPASLATSDSTLADFLPAVDAVRGELERLARDCGTESNLAGRVRDEFVVLAGAGAQAESRDSGPTRVGRRLPFVAPIGTVLASWGDESDMARWVSPTSDPTADDLVRWTELRAATRRRGYVIGNGAAPYASLENALAGWTGGSPAEELEVALAHVRRLMLNQATVGEARERYDIQSLNAPIFLPDGRALQIGLFGLRTDMSHDVLCRNLRRLLQAGRACTDLLGGELPADYPDVDAALSEVAHHEPGMGRLGL